MDEKALLTLDYIERIENNSTPPEMVEETKKIMEECGLSYDLSLTRMRIYFKNGRELSIVKGQSSFGGSRGLYEIMIDGLEGDRDLYDKADKADNADIVLGYLDAERVRYYIHKIGLIP